MLAAIGFAYALQSDSPYNLNIGRPGTTVLQSGRLTRLSDGLGTTPDDVAKAADRKRFVFLGEQHATAPDQEMEAAVIEALVRRRRNVVVGLEMYQRSKQNILDDFSAGKLEEAAFLEQSDWKGQWGFDYSFYRPVFDSVRRHRLPLVGLNVPRDWVRAVGRGGLNALPADAKTQLPAEIATVGDHRKVFEALMGGHPMTGPAGDNMLAAQTLWDVGMADTAAKWLDTHRANGKTVFVIIAGSGHVMYGQGINLRLGMRKAGEGVTLVMAESSEPLTVSNGLADFVYVSPAPRTAG